MSKLVLAVLLAAALPAGAALADAVTVRPVFSTTTTASGQPIVLPKDKPQVLVSTYDIAPGAKLPVHRHPFPRYAYVLAGSLEVTNPDTGASTRYKAGDFIVEMLNQWHYGANVGTEPVRLLVIDQVEEGHANTELKRD